MMIMTMSRRMKLVHTYVPTTEYVMIPSRRTASADSGTVDRANDDDENVVSK